MWILSSEEFLKECVTNRNGKNADKHGIWFNGRRTDKKPGQKVEYEIVNNSWQIFYNLHSRDSSLGLAL